MVDFKRTTYDGKSLYVSEMTDSHLQNTINLMSRQGEERTVEVLELEQSLRKVGKHLPKSEKRRFLESIGEVARKHDIIENYSLS